MNRRAHAASRTLANSIASVVTGFTTGIIHFFVCLWRVLFDQYMRLNRQSSNDEWMRIWRGFALQALLFVMLHTGFYRVVLPLNRWTRDTLSPSRAMGETWLWNICFIFWLMPGLAVCRLYSIKACQIVFEKNWIALTKARRARTISTGSHIENVMSVMTPGLTYWSLFALEQLYRRPVLLPAYAFTYSFLYSFYAFNYPWTAKSVDFFTQCVKMSRNWPYFVGFSFPFTALLNLLSVNIAFGSLSFATLFPLMILSASLASSQDMDTKTSAPFACHIMQPGLLISLFIIYLFSSVMNVLTPLPARQHAEQSDPSAPAESVKRELAKAFGHRTQSVAVSAVSAPHANDCERTDHSDGREDNDDSAYIVIDNNLDEWIVRRQ